MLANHVTLIILKALHSIFPVVLLIFLFHVLEIFFILTLKKISLENILLWDTISEILVNQFACATRVYK